MLFLAAAAVAALSPLSVDVVTSDGVHRAVAVSDADATPVQVCARKRGVAGEVCGDVVSDRFGMRAAVDVEDHGDLDFSLRVTRFDARAGAPAALAGGFAVLAVGTGVSAFVLGAVAAADVDVAASAAVDDNGEGGAGATASLSLSLWTLSGAAALGAGIASYVAWSEANTVVAE